MRVLITGAGGQVGCDLAATAPKNATVRACSHGQLDITSDSAVETVISEFRPDLMFNCAAYTAVDACETNRETAWKANAEAPGQIARICRSAGVRLVHLSTDYVFGGDSTQPYEPDDPVSPRSEYGRSKAEGERRVCEADPLAVVVRTSWVYGPGQNNFPQKILARSRIQDELRVVDDQRGAPTWSHDLAHALWLLPVRPDVTGLLHWTASGNCTWYEFAKAIVEGAQKRGELIRAKRVVPVSSTEFAAPARRPAWSVLSLDKWNQLFPAQPPRHWKDQLSDYLDSCLKRP